MHLLNSKKTAAELRDGKKRTAEREGRELRRAVKDSGLPVAPLMLANMAIRNVVRLEAAAARVTEKLETLPICNRSGAPSPLLMAQSSVIDRLLGELRALLNTLVQNRPQDPASTGPLRFRIILHDGRELPDGSTGMADADLRAMLAPAQPPTPPHAPRESVAEPEVVPEADLPAGAQPDVDEDVQAEAETRVPSTQVPSPAPTRFSRAEFENLTPTARAAVPPWCRPN